MTVDIPLSPTQTDLLSQQYISPWDRAAYCPVTWEIDGDLDQEALAAAVCHVHQRHEALGAAYLSLRGGPVARTGQGVAPRVTMLDKASSMDGAVASLRRELSRELEISAGQVWRAALVPEVPRPDGGVTSLFGCVVHHIAFDGWSESVLASDLAVAYDAYQGGTDPALPELPSLAEAWAVVESHRRHADIPGQLATLAQRIRGVPQLAWPVTRDISPDDEGSSQSVGLPSVVRTVGPAEITALDKAARARRVSRFVVLLAAYGHALARMTGQDDFAVGVPVTRRLDSRLDACVGCYIEMACIRMSEAALAPGGDGVAGTQSLMDLAFSTRDVGFGEVVRAVNPARGRKTALAQNIFVYQDHPAPRLHVRDRRTRLFRQPYFDIPAELQTDIWPLEDRGLGIAIHFQPSAIGRSSVEDLMRLFEGCCHDMARLAAVQEEEHGFGDQRS